MRTKNQTNRRLAASRVAVVGSTLFLTGCGDHSVSGAYISQTGNQASLLQITETPDHHLTGTLRHAALKNDGTVSFDSTNISGAVDGHNITMTVLAPLLPIGKNFGGSVTSNGIDFTILTKAQSGIEHFSKGQIADFDAAVARLNNEGQPIIAARERGRKIEQLDQQVNMLTNNLNRFVARAHEWIGRLPSAPAYYAQVINVEKAKLDRAQRLSATGDVAARGQAWAIVGQMAADKSRITITENSFDQDQKEDAVAENTLNAGIAQWQGNCLGTSIVKPGDVIPDMGPCKMLSRAVDAYNAMLPSLHNSFAVAAQAKAHGHAQLAFIWRQAEQVH